MRVSKDPEAEGTSVTAELSPLKGKVVVIFTLSLVAEVVAAGLKDTISVTSLKATLGAV